MKYINMNRIELEYRYLTFQSTMGILNYNVVLLEGSVVLSKLVIHSSPLSIDRLSVL